MTSKRDIRVFQSEVLTDYTPFAFSRDGRFILGTVIRDRYGNELGQLHVKSSLDFADADQYGIEHLAFSADGSLVIRTYHDTITTWKTRTFEQEMQWSDEARITYYCGCSGRNHSYRAHRRYSS